MNSHDKDQLSGFTIQDAKVHMEAGDPLRALGMLETLLKQYPNHGEIKALTLEARKLSSLSVPVVIKTKSEEIVEVKSHPSWWRKFF